MIVNASLILIWFCFASIALNPRVKVRWFAKMVMCIGMVNIIGVLAIDQYKLQSQQGLFAVFAFLFAYATVIIHKRGTYK